MAASRPMKGGFRCMGHVMTIDQQMLDVAADWHARLDGGDPDFEGYIAWLEKDPRHREAYNRVIALELFVTDHAPTLREGFARPLPANDTAPATLGQPAWKRYGVAAALAVMVASATLVTTNPFSSQIEIGTDASAGRTVQLADSSSVVLDGNSRISYNKDNPRALSLEQGTAMFSVHHDVARPFTVDVGSYQVRDIGTEFAISRISGRTTISVASGSVEIGGPGMKPFVALPGDRIDIVKGKTQRSRIDPASVASWRSGRLVYDNAPLDLVVADINRYANKPVEIDLAASAQRFSGVLTIGDGTQLAPTLASLAGLSLTDRGSTAQLGPRNGS